MDVQMLITGGSLIAGSAGLWWGVNRARSAAFCHLLVEGLRVQLAAEKEAAAAASKKHGEEMATAERNLNNAYTLADRNAEELTELRAFKADKDAKAKRDADRKKAKRADIADAHAKAGKATATKTKSGRA